MHRATSGLVQRQEEKVEEVHAGAGFPLRALHRDLDGKCADTATLPSQPTWLSLAAARIGSYLRERAEAVSGGLEVSGDGSDMIFVSNKCTILRIK